MKAPIDDRPLIWRSGLLEQAAIALSKVAACEGVPAGVSDEPEAGAQ